MTDDLHLVVVVEVDGFVHGVVVHYHHHTRVVGVAEIDVDAVNGQELAHGSIVQGRAMFAEREQRFGVVVDVVFERSALCRVESVVRVVGPTTGESVARLFVGASVAFNHYLVAIVELRIAANGRNHRQAHLVEFRVATDQRCITIHVVVV